MIQCQRWHHRKEEEAVMKEPTFYLHSNTIGIEMDETDLFYSLLLADVSVAPASRLCLLAHLLTRGFFACQTWIKGRVHLSPTRGPFWSIISLSG